MNVSIKQVNFWKIHCKAKKVVKNIFANKRKYFSLQSLANTTCIKYWEYEFAIGYISRIYPWHWCKSVHGDSYDSLVQASLEQNSVHLQTLILYKLKRLLVALPTLVVHCLVDQFCIPHCLVFIAVSSTTVQQVQI